MNVCVLGGTIFAGRHIVEAARAAGHDVTLFNRGRTNAGLFPDVEQITGDRTGDLAALRGRAFDAVIDTSGYVPRVVRASAELFRATPARYVFISTVSVYPDTSIVGIDEDTPVAVPDDPSSDELTNESYGPLKAACETALRETLAADRTLIVRPGLIVGPHDPSDRFTYWVRRLSRGGTILAPGRPTRGVQFIDARDLAEWLVRALDAGLAGTFNAVGPEQPAPMGDVIDACARAAASDAHVEWVDEAFLLAHGVAPWVDLPLWVTESDPATAGFMTISGARARAAGLRSRSVEETVVDTRAWDRTRAQDAPLRTGMTPERETELLTAWSRYPG